MTQETGDGKVIAFRLKRKKSPDDSEQTPADILRELLTLAEAGKLTAISCIFVKVERDETGSYEVPGEFNGGYVQDPLVLAAMTGIAHKNSIEMADSMTAAEGF